MGVEVDLSIESTRDDPLSAEYGAQSMVIGGENVDDATNHEAIKGQTRTSGNLRYFLQVRARRFKNPKVESNLSDRSDLDVGPSIRPFCEMLPPLCTSTGPSRLGLQYSPCRA